MAFVITSACQNEKAATCLAACLVDCIVLAGTQYVIDPDVCIDCGACETVCPVEAIYPQEELPADELGVIDLARNYFKP